MSSSKSRNSEGRRGQASFELIIVLAAASLVCAAIILDISNESTDSFVLSAIKAKATQELAVSNANLPQCASAGIKSMSVSSGAVKTVTLRLNNPTCTLNVSKVADSIEQELCRAVPNGDSMIRCGAGYELVTA